MKNDRPEPKSKLMSQADIEAEFGVPRRDILRWTRKGLFPAPERIIGRKYWFVRAEVEAFWQAGRPMILDEKR